MHAKQYFLAHKKELVLLGILFLFNIGLQTLAPAILGRFVDTVEGGGALQTVIWMILFYFVAVVLQTGGEALTGYRSQALGLKITDQYRRDVLEHYLNMDIRQHNAWRSGEIITRLDEDSQGLFRYWNILVFQLGASSLMLLCVLTVLFFQDGLLAVILLAVSLLAILGFKQIQDLGVAKYVRSQKATAEFNGVMKETVDNAAELHSLNAVPFGITELKSAMKRRFHDNLPAGLMYGNLWSAATLMQMAVQISALIFGLYLWDKGQITAGTVFMIYTYTELVMNPLQDFRNHMGGLQEARGGIARMGELLSRPTDPPGGTKVLQEEAISLQIEGLSFSYDGETEVLQNLNLSLPAGTKLGIMGETGCGKSTLVGLVAGLYDYKQGSIRINGIELREISRKSLLRQVAYCTQNVQLFHGTLRENITLYDREISDKAVWKAIDSLGLRHWFSRYRQGLDTMLTLGENSLSAGEAQLVTLCRLALKQPKLILLDEITARLDDKTERQILASIEALCKGKTVISIAHRVSATGWMDRILHMEQGVFAEGGAAK